ncbi:hypothetical protein [Hyalangium versicolor]|uniref:hypothetical protein n=1 Tax=Hyalangium versicolor TaxID=2861190 RepID=UPI001CCB23E4|nr:hypothetical protein [Hyalangium versicolor]
MTLLAVFWVFSTPLMVLAAFAFAMSELVDERRHILRRIGLPLVAALFCVALWVGNPLLNMFTFQVPGSSSTRTPSASASRMAS